MQCRWQCRLSLLGRARKPDVERTSQGKVSYQGTDEAGQCWFIKLSRDDTLQVGRVSTYLYDRLGLSFVLASLVNANPEQPMVGDYYLTVYPFIDGEVLGGTDLTSYDAEIGRDLRTLHHASLPPQLAEMLSRESFDRFQVSVRELVAKARSYAGNDALKQSIAACMQAHAEPIDAVLKNGADQRLLQTSGTYV